MKELYMYEQDAFSCLMYYKLNTTGERFATLVEEDANARFLQNELAKRGIQLVMHNQFRNEFYAFLRKFQKYVEYDGENTLSLTDLVDNNNFLTIFQMGVLPLPIVEVVCQQIKNYSTQQTQMQEK